jgi:predicted NAD/FAD-binding protein
MTSTNRMRIAVIGSGISGLSAAWLLDLRHDVTLYEQNRKLGGHSNTLEALFDGTKVDVDTGFIVYNTLNYPNLEALFQYLGVKTKASDMSFSASLGNGSLEYSGTNLWALFGQPKNLFRPSFLKMLWDLKRFYRQAPNQLKDGTLKNLTLGEYLIENMYSAPFVQNHILPMGAAIWSTTPQAMRDYPAEAFIRFFESHGLLTISGRPEWRTVDGGSKQYVKLLEQNFSGKTRMSGVTKVERSADNVRVTSIDGQTDVFDHVVIGTHADQALKLLQDPSPEEQSLLGVWRYTKNTAVLHSDPELMPKRRRVWASWNFIQKQSEAQYTPLCVTYWMNLLQSIPEAYPLFVTLNPPPDQTIHGTHSVVDYEHPFFDSAALKSQGELWSLQGKRRTWFCGSYFGYGFHEDGLESGLSIAEQLGEVERPWKIPDGKSRIQISQSRMVV